MIAIQTTGVVLGNMIGQGATGFISTNYGWETAFILSGLLMLIFTLLWLLMVTDRPDDEKKSELVCFVKRKFSIATNMTTAEKLLLAENRQIKAEQKVPWKAILTSRPVQIATIAWFSMTYTIYNCTNNLPLFLAKVHMLNTDEIGAIFGGVAFFTALVGVPAAMLADKLRTQITTTQERIFTDIFVLHFMFEIRSICLNQSQKIGQLRYLAESF